MQTGNFIIRFLFLAGLLLPGPFSFGQDTPRTDSITVIRVQPNVVTRVPFNGTNYCIRIAPLTTCNIDNMPIFNPKLTNPHSFVVPDSLQLPDPFVRRLRKLEEDRLKQR